MSIRGQDNEGVFGELRPGGESTGQVVRLGGMSAPSLAEIAGREEELRRLREAVELPLKIGDALRKKGIHAPRVVAVYGPPGTGKTMLIKAFAADAGLRLFIVRWPQLVARSDDESRRLLADAMARARANLPSVVLIDDVGYGGYGYGSTDELSRKKAAQITEAVDTLSRDEKMVVIIVSPGRDAMDPAMRKAGYLAEEIEFKLPDQADRRAILSLQTSGLTLQDVDMTRLAAAAEGFSGADLALLVRNAFMAALRRAAADGDITPDIVENVKLTDADFRQARQALQKKALPESLGDVN